MRILTKEIHDRHKAVVGTVEVEQADTLNECIQLAGSEPNAVAMFNRAWSEFKMNKGRPKKSKAFVSTMVKGFKSLSPEVQAILRTKTPEEIAELLAKIG